MTQLTWHIARSSGIVGWALVSASVLWGLALSTKAFGRRPRPSWLLDLHRFLAGTAVIFVGIHVTAILLDQYTDFGPVNVLVPLTGSWHPLAVAWGVVAMYLLVAVEITSLLMRRIKKRVWRRFHYLSFPLFVFSTIHLLVAGTDANSHAMRWATALVVLAVASLVWIRTSEPPDASPVRRRNEASIRRSDA